MNDKRYAEPLEPAVMVVGLVFAASVLAGIVALW